MFKGNSFNSRIHHLIASIQINSNSKSPQKETASKRCNQINSKPPLKLNRSQYKTANILLNNNLPLNMRESINVRNKRFFFLEEMNRKIYRWHFNTEIFFQFFLCLEFCFCYLFDLFYYNIFIFLGSWTQTFLVLSQTRR
jgi:hypothetical protein